MKRNVGHRPRIADTLERRAVDVATEIRRPRGRPKRWSPRALIALWYEVQFERELNERTLDAALLAVRNFHRYRRDKVQSLRARYKEACALNTDPHWGRTMRLMRRKLAALPSVNAPTPEEFKRVLAQMREEEKKPIR